MCTLEMQIDELKLMQNNPKLFLNQYFKALRNSVETEYVLNCMYTDKYMEIMETIASKMFTTIMTQN
jgi:hypothetical protein